MMLLIILSYLWLSLIVSSKALSDAATPAQRRNISTKNQKFLTVKKLDARTLPLYCFVRAGDSSADDDQQQDDVEEEEEEYDDDDEIEEEEDEDDDTLTTSSIRSAQKSVKTELAQVIMEQKNKPIRRKRKQNFSFLLKMPYILRALLNPFTVMSMTKSYFASLLNIDYMKDEDPSQNLRSALSAKARKGGSSSSPKPKRTFKPGQAKTLHDLPQLSA